VIWNVKPRLAPPVNRSRTKMIVVSAATISTTNMTGFLMRRRGSSLANEARMAGTTMAGSASAVTGIRLRSMEVSMVATRMRMRSEDGPGPHGEVLDNRSERQRREIDQAADDE